MRVLIVSVNFAPENVGIGPYIGDLAAGLAVRGHQVRVLTSYPHFPEWRVDRRLAYDSPTSVGVTRLRHFTPRNPTLLRRALFEVSFGAHAVCSRWGRPDVVLATSPALFATAMVVVKAQLRRRPVGVIVQDLYGVGVHEATHVRSPVAKVVSAVESRTLRSATAVSVIHHNFVETLRAEGYSSEHISVIQNWAHTASASPVDVQASRAALGWGPDEIVVLHTGSMGAKQGLSSVVDAARYADTVGAPVRFVLMGDGPAKADLQRAAAGVGRIQFARAVDDADYPRVLASADILLVSELPGVGEMALPSKLTSYFFAGKPVVAATGLKGATASEIRASGGGVLTPPGAPKLLVDAVLAVAADPIEASRMGAAGHAHALANLAADRAIDSYADWCQELASNEVSESTDSARQRYWRSVLTARRETQLPPGVTPEPAGLQWMRSCLNLSRRQSGPKVR